MLTIYAEKFRGFDKICLPLDNVTFLTGDNSSGKTSIMYLIGFILSSELSRALHLRHEGVAPYDYFSPYFEYADVIIGYANQGGEESQYKFITIKRTREGGGEVTRVTVAKSGFALSLHQGRTGVRSRLVPVENFHDIDSIVEIHKSDLGYGRVDSELDVLSPLNTEESIIRSSIRFVQEKEHREMFFKVMSRTTLPDTSFIAALRAEPALYYSRDRRYQRRGEHFAAMAHDLQSLLPDDKRTEAAQALKDFGKNSGLFDDVKFIVDKKRKGKSPVYVDIYKDGKVLGLNQLGFGLSQVLPIMVELIFAKYFTKNCVICLQQPELHLHPKAQAAFGEVFLEMAADDERLVIETHSDFIIDRFRSVMHRKSGGISASVIFCQKSEKGNTAHIIRIDDKGNLLSPPDDYRDFFMAELARTL